MRRLEALRTRALEPDRLGEEFYYLFYRAFCASKELPEYERYAHCFYEAFSRLTPVIGEGELIVGSRDHAMSDEEQAEWESIYRLVWQTHGHQPGQDSHMAVDYPLVLEVGLEGICQRIDGLLAVCEEEKKTFYRCCRRCLEAVILHSLHYAEEAERQASLAVQEERKKELLTIADICRRVPAKPAKSFYEAVQSVSFLTHCLSLNPFRIGYQQFQLGHPDRYLLPFYEKDLAEGNLTPEFAQLLLDCLGIQINMRVPNGLSSGYMLGGRDEKGNVVANDLTRMGMQVIDDIRLVYPAVGLCWTRELPDAFMKQACELLAKGRSHPAIFNDEVITRGLLHYGLSPEEACNYIHSTCVEITPVAASNVWVASPYTNLPQLLLDCMDREYPDFEAFRAAFLDRLDSSIRKNFEEQNAFRRLRAEQSVNPLLSCLVYDCLARGLDIERGGARYNWIMPSFVGMANLVDAMYAIRQLVYLQKRLTLTEFKTITQGDFAGNEPLRQYILHKLPKYGNDIDEVDALFGFFSEHIVHACSGYCGMHTNGRLIPSVFCWVMHERFGTQTGATPDGRPAHFPLGDGSGPCQGRETGGPTASVLSATKWAHEKFIGGVAVNLKFARTALGPNHLDAMLAVVKTYLLRGGFELQINVVDNETLKKAQQTPELYRDLVVRIGGYSDYFVTLSPEMQAEVIQRTAHSIE